MIRFISRLFSRVVSWWAHPSFQEEEDHYPFHHSLKTYLPDGYAPLFGFRFLRSLSEDMGISLTQVEIVILLASERDGIYLDELIREMDNVSPAYLKRLLKDLINRGIVWRVSDPGDAPIYGIHPNVLSDIGNYHNY